MQFILTEKPSVAVAIAAVLNVKERKDGFFIGNNYIISYCVGHLIELANANSYNEKYAQWRYADLPIIPQEWLYNIAKDKGKQLKIISDIMKRIDVDTVICATDAGREGELIFRLVYNQCRCKKPIKRLWISSMEEKAILDGFQKLKDGAEYEKLYQAALCRSQADWIVGINATRLFSVIYGDTLNIGRVMTPTLALIVQREQDIASFTKEPFYTVQLHCPDFMATSEKQKDKHIAEKVQSLCNNKRACVTSLENKEKTVSPPKLYDLTTLQREANRLLGFTSQQTLDYVQSLYEKKLVTYPRTDSQYLTEDMASSLPSLIDGVTNKITFINETIYSPNFHRIIDNKKVTDHHAIIPTQTMTQTDITTLPTGELEILLMIGTRLLCAIAENHQFTETIVTLSCENHIFQSKGKVVTNSGFKSIMQSYTNRFKSDETEEEKTLPVIAVSEVFEVTSSIQEGFTAPPKFFTEDTLLSAMENAGNSPDITTDERKGLGTPATRAGIIEKLIKTGFIERKTGKKAKNLLPTEKGINLITVLPEVIKSPKLTADWECKLKQIEQNSLSCNEFMAGITALTTELVKTNSTPNPQYMSLFSSSIQTKANTVGICPRCGNPVYEGNKGFFCANKGCHFTLWKENKFFALKKKTLNFNVAATLLKDGRVCMSNLFSEKTGKTYNATIVLNDTGGKYVNFKLEFNAGKKG